MNASAATDLWKVFDEIHPDLKPKQVMEEANRCLFCFDAPCTKACPTGIDVPSFIRKIATGNLKGSARVIMEANPMGATCARVCPTEELCEGACVLGEASLPVMIGDLQKHATNWAMKNHPQLFEAGKPSGREIAIVGAGPAGLSAARQLARFGHQVTIYEKREKPGGLDTYGIVPFRLPQKVALWEADQVEQLGVMIKTGIAVGRDISADFIQTHFDAVMLAVGMADVPDLGIPGEELDGVFSALELIEKVKDGQVTDRFMGRTAIVVGAGNTAIDAATTLKRLGATRVQMIYRRTESEMTAYPAEYRFAKEDGITCSWLTQPKKVIGDTAGRVTGVECARMRLGKPDGSGRRRPIEIENSNFLLEADIFVKAIGQGRHTSLIDAFRLKHDHGIVSVDARTFQTSDPNVFAAGDVTFGNGSGEATVVAAAQQGKLAALAIHRQLMSRV
ncbi:NAD(P)-dependent oxidoreductase [Sporolactobacillus sp. CPB3-1]|uniref:NAD(P)-dependent oxidoreductase n=1 Tax=Sporolactobacillus mangiferae TaxID=2940498 RepID=A0ABT0M9N2_9BACL|nr:NAD(P)-dependent oxidoreductase [Sporolactobacillus mangiferae]MCL1631580.1 NAD(P)-dependent oxidoreductase [Sporolactobacillus mangiferae]